MDFEVTSFVMDGLRKAARDAHPNEACGILLGEGHFITDFRAAKNVHLTPRTHFEIDPQALIAAHRAERDSGPQVLGYFHSHPAGDPKPSATDIAMAAGDGAIWAIFGGDQIGWWQSEKTGFRPLTVSIAAK